MTPPHKMVKARSQHIRNFQAEASIGPQAGAVALAAYVLDIMLSEQMGKTEPMNKGGAKYMAFKMAIESLGYAYAPGDYKTKVSIKKAERPEIAAIELTQGLLFDEQSRVYYRLRPRHDTIIIPKSTTIDGFLAVGEITWGSAKERGRGVVNRINNATHTQPSEVVMLSGKNKKALEEKGFVFTSQGIKELRSIFEKQTPHKKKIEPLTGAIPARWNPIKGATIIGPIIPFGG